MVPGDPALRRPGIPRHWRVVRRVVAWFAILFTGQYPRGLFDFVVGVGRWGLRGKRLHSPAGDRSLSAIQLAVEPRPVRGVEERT